MATGPRGRRNVGIAACITHARAGSSPSGSRPNTATPPEEASHGHERDAGRQTVSEIGGHKKTRWGRATGWDRAARRLGREGCPTPWLAAPSRKVVVGSAREQCVRAARTGAAPLPPPRGGRDTLGGCGDNPAPQPDIMVEDRPPPVPALSDTVPSTLAPAARYASGRGPGPQATASAPGAAGRRTSAPPGASYARRVPSSTASAIGPA